MKHKTLRIIIVVLVPLIISIALGITTKITSVGANIIYFIFYGILSHFFLEKSNENGIEYVDKRMYINLIISSFMLILSIFGLLFIKLKFILGGTNLLFIQVVLAMCVSFCTVYICNTVVSIIKYKIQLRKKEKRDM